MQIKEHHRFLALITVVLLMCIIALSATFHSAPTAQAAGLSCQVTYTVIAQWPASSQAPGGFEAALSIKNTGSTAINGWAVQFTFPNGQVIFAHFGGGNLTQAGADVTFTNASFNGTIAPGSTVFYAPGFNANWYGVNNPPASFTLNGVLCSNG